MSRPADNAGGPVPWDRAIVVGASSGIGEQISRELARRGASVALIGRRRSRLEAICTDINTGCGRNVAFAIEHDVRNTAEVEALFGDITRRLGGLDLVVYAAGVMPRIGPNEFPTATDRATIETNFLGAVAWLNVAATRFGRAREGTIVGISSVAGDRGRKGNVAYGASKAALNAYLESLRNRLGTSGVRVVTVKPGYVQTSLVEGLTLPRLFPVISAEVAANAILSAAQRGKPVAYVPRFWKYVMGVIRLLPSGLMQRLNF